VGFTYDHILTTIELEFLNSQKGHRQLVYDGFTNSFERTVQEKSYWACVHHRKRNCPGRCHTVDGKLIKQTDHNHVPNIISIEVKKAIGEIKMKTNERTESTQDIIAMTSLTIKPSLAGTMPSVNLLKRTIQRTRNLTKCRLSNPTSLLDLTILDYLTKTSKKADFLLFDSGSGLDHILIFATHKNLEIFSKCKEWYADGTFKSAPLLFEQLFRIHCKYHDIILPTVFALLPNKREETYVRVLAAMKNLEKNLNPETTLILRQD